jgi:hypothetical protein
MICEERPSPPCCKIIDMKNLAPFKNLNSNHNNSIHGIGNDPGNSTPLCANYPVGEYKGKPFPPSGRGPEI